VEYDLIHDVHKKDKTPLSVLSEMEKSGIILDSKINIEAVGTLEDHNTSTRIPFLVLFATILESNMINALFDVEEECIYELTDDLTLRPIGQLITSETTASKKEESETPSEKVLPKIPAIKAEEPKETAEPVQATGKETIGGKIEQPGTALNDASLRVQVSLLDSLMNLAGELVLGRNQLLQSIISKDARTTEAAGQRLDLITTELQEAIMLTRMQSIGNVFNKFPRVVRDLARNLGKEVELTLEGKDVELDKTILEAISDPLTHLIRNSVDHGIETPDERRKAGKDPTGKVRLRAYHEAGQVNIEITDDGKGLDGNKLAEAAVSKGLMAEEKARVISEKEGSITGFLK
jgi:two-component system chemotaxis sensor kinase CheA